MARDLEIVYQTPPLAGRPPFATDDDSVYDKQPQPTPRRIRQPPPPNPNARTSAYNVYDNYLEEGHRDSGIGALGKGFLNVDMDDDEDDPFDDKHKKASMDASRQATQQPIPLAAPKPGYATTVSALNLSRPSPVASPEGRQPSPQMSQTKGPKPLTLVNNLNNPRIPPPAAISVPSTPHPLQAPMVPIMPVFARPSNGRDVKFADAAPILRSDKEETLLPKRGERGDDFWRRFSMVAKQENAKPQAQKQSPWLRKTQSGASRMSRWVWVVAILLLLCIAGGIALGWYLTHNNTSHDAPTAIGGSANEKAIESSSSAAPSSGAKVSTSSSFHVTPTNTVARRDVTPEAEPTQNLIPPDVTHMDLNKIGSNQNLVRIVPPSRHRRIHTNRTTH